jgi:hypothetical protein
LTGVVNGYNGSLLEVSDFARVDTTSFVCECIGKGIGTFLSLNPKQLTKNALKGAANLASKEITDQVATNVVTKASKVVTSGTKSAVNTATQKTTQVAESQFGKKRVNNWKFPENPNELLSELPRDRKGRIFPCDKIRIRPEKHAMGPNEVYNPRHHGQHYHVEVLHRSREGGTKINILKPWSHLVMN